MFSLTHLQFLSLLFKEKSQFLQLPLLPQSPGAVPVGRLGVMTTGEEATVNRCLGNGFSEDGSDTSLGIMGRHGLGMRLEMRLERP